MADEMGKDIVQPVVSVLEKRESLVAQHRLKDPHDAIASLWAERGRLRASGGENFRDGFFGRDTIEVAEDLLEVKPRVAEDVIPILASYQGVAYKPTGIAELDLPIKQMYDARGEEPGKMFHEQRQLYINGKRIGESSERILRELAMKWGGTSEHVIYYGSLDATPLYARLIGEYYEHVANGKEILGIQYTPKDRGKHEEPATIKEGYLAAISWIEANLAKSDFGFLEFKPNTPNDIENQVWMDSKTSYVHEMNGVAVNANHEAPIAPIEVQAYAYDALLYASRIFAESRPKDAKRWGELASKLAKKTIAQFWMEDEQYFAMGLDREPETRKSRQIKTLSANGALILDSDMLDTLEPSEKQKCITGIVNMIFSDEFLTEVGVRSRGKRYAKLLKLTKGGEYLSDYHGSEVSWIKETFDISRGLRRQGLHGLAREFELRIIKAVETAGEYYEFFYVDLDGNVNYHPKDTGLPFANGRKVLFGTNLPDEDQAWTISAVIASRYNVDHKPVEAMEGSWEAQLEDKILSSIKAQGALTHVSDDVIPFVIERRLEPPVAA